MHKARQTYGSGKRKIRFGDHSQNRSDRSVAWPSTFLFFDPKCRGAARIWGAGLKVADEPGLMPQEDASWSPRLWLQLRRKGPMKTLLCCPRTHTVTRVQWEDLYHRITFSMCYYLTRSCDPPAEEKAQRKCWQSETEELIFTISGAEVGKWSQMFDPCKCHIIKRFLLS